MASSASSSSSNHCRKHVGSKSMEMEEIVKHMSDLPSYLERGKPIQDRALNFGVLDWGRLEQWQYHHHKQGVIGTNKHSPSGINSSSGASLLSFLNMPHEEVSTKAALVNHSSEKKTTNQSRTKPRGSKSNDFHPQHVPESRSSVDMGTFQTASSSSTSSSFSKGKMKIQDELENEIRNLQDLSYGHKTLVLNGEKSEDIRSDSNESSSKKTSRKHRFKIIFKSEAAKSATKAAESPPTSQNSSEDSKIKEIVKMGLGNCKEVGVNNSCRNEMNSSSRKHALFQVAVKNGHPLFTFAVDDTNNNIVAATVRNLTGKDDTNSWIYTFFTVHEVKKKKSGWLYHGTKDKDHGYLPNVTAQMKVSNPSPTNCTTREFVLSSVDSSQPDSQILDVQLENELAAIVVRFPGKEDDEENQDCFSMTVILPGGHHSVPRKGDPSPLIQRWRSGGRCDCDGWDVGCRLRILTNKVQSDKRSNPSESFNLFLQGDVINESPFSLSPVKEGIFSVDYNSSLPLMHAFSICISVIECRKSSQHTELRTYVAKQVDDDVSPITYASLLPVSPVGRIQLNI